MEDLSPSAGGTSTSTRAPAATTAPAATQSAETSSSAADRRRNSKRSSADSQRKPAAPESAAPASETKEVAAIPSATSSDERFQWPLQGKIISRFGAKNGGQHNDGINIAAKEGAKVYAADSGTVAYAGNELKGFGNLLLIRHTDGWITAYAHNEKLLVKKGDKVSRGQPIALVGATGNVEFTATPFRDPPRLRSRRPDAAPGRPGLASSSPPRLALPCDPVRLRRKLPDILARVVALAGAVDTLARCRAPAAVAATTPSAFDRSLRHSVACRQAFRSANRRRCRCSPCSGSLPSGASADAAPGRTCRSLNSPLILTGTSNAKTLVEAATD